MQLSYHVFGFSILFKPSSIQGGIDTDRKQPCLITWRFIADKLNFPIAFEITKCVNILSFIPLRTQSKKSLLLYFIFEYYLLNKTNG